MRNNQNFRERFEGINPGEGPVFSYTKLLDATPQFEVTLGDASELHAENYVPGKRTNLY